MKKAFALLLALILLLTPLAAWAEGDPTPPPLPEEPACEPLPEEYLPLSQRVLGDWYADYAGLLISLTLGEDGSYALLAPGIEAQTGQWEARDGQLFLDGGEEAAITPLNGVLCFEGLDLLFTREQPLTYVPADVAEAAEGDFDGFWKVRFVAVGEGTALAQALHEDTFVYIEGTNVALGGERFGDVIRVFTAADKALTLTEGESTISLQLQQDGFLRLTIAGPEPATLYLMPAPIPGQAPAQEP
ncbi:MAG: hypothetical protein IJH54_05445 [Clostridia bacterium]|nr:hypothetical protein [Clostridia bacterium]